MESRFKFGESTVKNAPSIKGKQAVYWDDLLPGFGLRVSPGGARSFFYQYRFGGRAKKITIGRWDVWKVKKARDEVKRLAGLVAAGKDPAPQKAEADASTFGDMLEGYCDLLEMQGKQSAKSVRNALEADVRDAHKHLWNRPANQITLDDCVKIVGRVKDAGKLRQADKLRSYIRTAFTKAINARGDVNAPEKLRSLNVKVNPARDMTIVHGSNNTRDRVLSLSEFHHYWQRVKQEPEPARSLLMLHVLTGGQRQVQLARVTLNDIDRDAPSMTLLDFKGRRTAPRLHEVPLLPEALDAIDRITGSGQFVFSANGGKTPIGEAYILDRVKKIVSDMDQAGELEKGPFTAGTIRATIETRLSAKPYRVQSDVLAQLLSHGLGGVQARHYQRHDFFEEKLEALEMLRRMAEAEPEPTAQVIDFSQARAQG